MQCVIVLSVMQERGNYLVPLPYLYYILPLNNGTRGLTYQYHFCYIALSVKRSVLALRLVGVGFYIGISIVLGVVAGRWLDDKFNTTFIFTITGLFLGLISAFYGTWQMIKPLLGNDDKGDD